MPYIPQLEKLGEVLDFEPYLLFVNEPAAKTQETEDLKGTEKYYSFHLPAEVNRVKGLTAIILKDALDEKDLPQMERREGQDFTSFNILTRSSTENNGDFALLFKTPTISLSKIFEERSMIS